MSKPLSLIAFARTNRLLSLDYAIDGILKGQERDDFAMDFTHKIRPNVQIVYSGRLTCIRQLVADYPPRRSTTGISIVDDLISDLGILRTHILRRKVAQPYTIALPNADDDFEAFASAVSDDNSFASWLKELAAKAPIPEREYWTEWGGKSRYVLRRP